jgi:polysaccharide transporter, PST family
LDGDVYLCALSFKKWILPATRRQAGQVTACLMSSFSVFQFRTAQSLTTYGSLVILGIVFPPGVAAFGNAERIVRNCLGLLGPISAAGMPKISRLLGTDLHAARGTARLSFFTMTGLGAAFAAMLYLFAPAVVRVLLGPAYVFVTPVLQLVSLALPFAAASAMLGVQWMLPLGMDRMLAGITLAGGLANVTGCIVFGYFFSAMGVAGTLVVVEIGMAAAMYVVVRRRSALF